MTSWQWFSLTRQYGTVLLLLVFSLETSSLGDMCNIYGHCSNHWISTNQIKAPFLNTVDLPKFKILRKYKKKYLKEITTPSLSPKRDVTWPDSDTTPNNFFHESRGRLCPFAFSGSNIFHETLLSVPHYQLVRELLPQNENVRTRPLQINPSDELFDGEYQKYLSDFSMALSKNAIWPLYKV